MLISAAEQSLQAVDSLPSISTAQTRRQSIRFCEDIKYVPNYAARAFWGHRMYGGDDETDAKTTTR
jgi:hypothetical protein